MKAQPVDLNLTFLEEPVRVVLSQGWNFWRPKNGVAENLIEAESAFRRAQTIDPTGVGSYVLGDFLLDTAREEEGVRYLKLSEAVGFEVAFIRQTRYAYEKGDKPFNLIPGPETLSKLRVLAQEGYIVAKILIVQCDPKYDGIMGTLISAFLGGKLLLQYKARMKRSGLRDTKNWG